MPAPPHRPPTRPPSRRPGALALGAAALAATAAWTAQRASRAEREHPPTGRLLTGDGVQLHVLERGEGPPVLLLHGNLCTHADFVASGLVDRLAEHHRVLAIDRPGYGHSRRPRDRLWTPQAQGELLLQALRALGAERPKIVAHSMGTLVALSMALQHPEAVRSLVLVSGYYFPTARVDAWLAAPVGWPVVGDVLRYTVAHLAGRALLAPQVRGIFAPRPVPAGYVETLGRELLLRPQQLRANAEDAACMVPAVQAVQSLYPHLAVPLTLLAGAEDRVADPQAHSLRCTRPWCKAACTCCRTWATWPTMRRRRAWWTRSSWPSEPAARPKKSHPGGWLEPVRRVAAPPADQAARRSSRRALVASSSCGRR